jgi:MFS family permease
MPLHESDVAMFRSVDETRRFYASPGVAWFLPAASGLTIGFFIAVVVSLISWRWLGDAQPLVTFFITMFIVAILVWVPLTRRAWGKIGLIRENQVTILRVKIEENDGRTLRLADFESVNEDELRKIAKMVVGGGSLSLRRLGVYLKGSQVEEFRLELIENRLAVFDDSNEVKLTPIGTKTFRELAHYPTERGSDA